MHRRIHARIDSSMRAGTGTRAHLHPALLDLRITRSALVQKIDSLELPELAPYRTCAGRWSIGSKYFVAEGEKVVRRLLESDSGSSRSCCRKNGSSNTNR